MSVKSTEIQELSQRSKTALAGLLSHSVDHQLFADEADLSFRVNATQMFHTHHRFQSCSRIHQRKRLLTFHQHIKKCHNLLCYANFRGSSFDIIFNVTVLLFFYYYCKRLSSLKKKNKLSGCILEHSV